ncbi:hypothetical protein N9009_01585 [bacterium]|nr:hypothetical protein [bacterium]
MFEDNYQVVAIATDKMEGGQAMFDEMKKGRCSAMMENTKSSVMKQVN